MISIYIIYIYVYMYVCSNLITCSFNFPFVLFCLDISVVLFELNNIS